MNTIFFIDSENVGDAWIDLFDYLQDGDQLLVFYTDKSPHMSYKNLIRLKQSAVEPTFIYCVNGSDNALDFQLTTYLGSLTVTNPEDQLVIITRDKGFDVVVKFWTERGINICRKAPSIFYTLLPEQDSPQADNEVTLVSESDFDHEETLDGESGLDSKVALDGEIAPSEETQKETQVETPEEITFDTEQIHCLIQCIGKANLSALHNVLVGIYGNEQGSNIYNTIKKSSYEVPKVNWQKKTKFRKFLRIVYSNADLSETDVSIGDDFFKKLYPKKENLREVHSLFVQNYGQENGKILYKYYKVHGELLKKTF